MDIEDRFSGDILQILREYKKGLKEILQDGIENLYGGGINEPVRNEENQETVIEIWDKAVDRFIALVKSL